MTGSVLLPPLLSLLLLGNGALDWPGSFAAETRAIGGLLDGPRLRAIERFTAGRLPDQDPETRAFLRSLLEDDDAAVRLYAGRRLVRAGDPAAVAAATKWIRQPRVPIVDRTFGLDILREATVLPPDAREMVERALRDPDATIRTQALDALERHELGSALSAVLATFDDDSREVRSRAVRLAASTGDPRAVLPLIARLEDADRQVRIDAVRGLGRHPRAVPVLLRIAQEGVDETRLAAIDALGDAKAESALDLLVRYARRRPADDLSRRAQLALGKLGAAGGPGAPGGLAKDAVAALVSMTRTPPVSAEVTEALRLLGGAAVPALVRTLDDGGPTAATVAVLVLSDIGDRRATGPLAAVVDDRRRTDLVPVAIDALARLRDPAGVPALARAAEAQDLEIRRRAFAALRAIADPRAVAVLDRGLRDPDPYVRRLAIELAATIDVRQAVPALVALLGDREAEPRRAAAAALAQLGTSTPGLAPAVVAAITRPTTPARERDEREWMIVGDALERVVAPEDGPALLAALTREEPPGADGRRGRDDLGGVLARGIAAAYARRPLLDRPAIERLIRIIAAGGWGAGAAADALATARLPDEARGPFASAYAEASPAVQARLCPTIATLPGGATWLASLAAASRTPREVRAAAAWAARGLDDARDTLAALAASTDPDDPVAANARAALAAGARAEGDGARAAAWAGVRLRTRDGVPEAGRWLALSGADGVAVWALTDGAGAVHLRGLPPGAVAVRPREDVLRAASPAGP